MSVETFGPPQEKLVHPTIECWVRDDMPDEDTINEWRAYVKAQVGGDMYGSRKHSTIDIIFDAAIRGRVGAIHVRHTIQESLATSLRQLADSIQPKENGGN